MPIVSRANRNVATKNMTLKHFYENRNKVLIYRTTGGLGDLLMHRMMFKDFKRIMPDAYLIFACLPQYMPALEEHPYLDKVIDYREVELKDYLIHYNTTSICIRYEQGLAPFSNANRSDIWSQHCGVEITDHDMHIDRDKLIPFGKKLIESKKEDKSQPSVLFCPMSAQRAKTLTESQMQIVVDYLKSKNCHVYTSHLYPIEELKKLNIPVYAGISIREWMCLVAASDYVVSVDTAAFHLAGNFGIPQTAIFTFADGLVYGKYYKNCILIQKHRNNGDWDCGPCYNWARCPKERKPIKPCLTQLTKQMFLDGIDLMFEKHPYNEPQNSHNITLLRTPVDGPQCLEKYIEM